MCPSRKVLNGGVLAVAAFVLITLCGLVFPGDGLDWLLEHFLFTVTAVVLGVCGLVLMSVGLGQQALGRGRSGEAERASVAQPR